MRIIELFSGAGGLALGLEAANFESVALIERDPHACATLKLNRPNWNVIETDIRDVDFSKFTDISLVAGGPPCQPFSMGGKAQGYDDSRDMFPHAIRAIHTLRPKAFILENVRGLLRDAFSHYVEFVRLQLTYPDFELLANSGWEGNLRRLQRYHTSVRREGVPHYNVSINLANAADYGVPQQRHRVFFVGFRSDIPANWSFPSPTASKAELDRAKFVTGDYWREHGLPVPRAVARGMRQVQEAEFHALVPRIARWMTVRDALMAPPLGRPSRRANALNHCYQPGARSYAGHTGSPLDEPSKALKAGDHGVPGGENMLRYGNGKVRYFSIRECARIQRFPDTYQFHGPWTECMRQIGNAVPVTLAERVGASVYEKLRIHEEAQQNV